MRTRAAALVLLLLAALAPGPAHARTATPQVDAYLRERAQATGTPGLAYAIVGPGGIESTGAFGHDGDGRPVTARTPFLWGSIAKPVTATAVMTLVESGAVDLDEPVRTYLPRFTLADRRAAARITVRHLLQQTSGLPEHTGVTDRFGDRDDPYGRGVADLADTAPRSAPGERHGYSSANYLLLGALVEAVTGRSYEAYLRDHVLGPLDMRGAVTTPRQAGAVPRGHGYVYGKAVASDTHYDPAGTAYGYLGGTVRDLARFAAAHLDGGTYDGTRVLTPASVAQMHRGTADSGDTQRYGLGWRDDTRNDDLDTRTVWHTGGAPGYHAMLVLLPDADRALVVLQNAYGYFQAADLNAAGFGAARILAGGDPGPAPGDAPYTAFLALLTAVLTLTTAATAWSAYRILRPARTSRTRRRILTTAGCWTLAALTTAALAGIAAPRAFGVDLRLIRLYAPDLGWLLTLTALTACTLAAVRLTAGCLSLRRATRGRR
ncbi:serine hydrolase domain-containing protein [Streptomyces sp. B8F3]|uniref:serine hydrolase domain-containing protein n=1 Tax=Streptomyces sp. B8F3 TaxID=3153573 RepID=UPI00325CB9E6